MSNSYFNNQIVNNRIKIFLEDKLPFKIKYGYFIINRKNLIDISIINNYPIWFDLYIKNNHQMTDPVVLKSLSVLGDFAWDDEISILSEIALPKVMLHASQHHINSGYTFVLHDYTDNLVLLSLFYENITEKEKIHSLKENIYYLLTETHNKLLSLYDTFKTNKKRFNSSMTERENEVLYWSSTGKTYNEISVILDISERTVKFHMNNIVKKLDAVNAKHAIRLAADLKLIINSSLK